MKKAAKTLLVFGAFFELTCGAVFASHAGVVYKIRITGHVTSVDSTDLNSVGISVGDRTVFEATIDFSNAIDQFAGNSTLFQAQNFYGWSAKYGGYQASSDQRGNYHGWNDRAGAPMDTFSLSSFEPIPGPGDFNVDMPPVGYSWRGISNIFIDDSATAFDTEDAAINIAKIASGEVTLANFTSWESHMAFQADGSTQYTRAYASVDGLWVHRIPEPTSIALIGLALTGLAATRRRSVPPLNQATVVTALPA